MAIMEVTKMEVKATSVFDFKEFYTVFHHFLMEEGYSMDADPGFPEKYYWESRTQTKGREYWVWWRFKNQPYHDNKFMCRIMEIDFHGVGVQDVEIMYKGKKMKLNKGKLEIIIRGKLELDPGDELKNSTFGFLQQIMINRVWNRERDAFKLEMVKDMKTLRDFCADFLKKPVPEVMYEAFHPKLGYEEENF